MNKETCKQLKYFSWSEIVDHSVNPFNIKFPLMKRLDQLRTELGKPIILLHLDTGRHVPRSYHYKGMAADVKIKGVPKNKILQKAIDVGFRGIGVYSTFWHFDVRDKCALWTRKDGIYKGII